ncbi:MAG: hypothetical protein OEV44_00080 [Spirochaetota bacterium]|nr:hypothetical protein [Spirochaetota bacterium]
MKNKKAEYFNYLTASMIEINDGCIKCIWLEYSNTNEFDNEGCVMLNNGDNALIEFENGKKMIITNSEWCSLKWLH